MYARWLALLISLCAVPVCGRGAEAVFSADGKRVWLVAGYPGELGCLAVDEQQGTAQADWKASLSAAGGPGTIRGLDLSQSGNLLLAAENAVWAFDPKTAKAVRVAALPAGFSPEDLAYQETTGAILVWGSFIRDDHSVDHRAAYRIGRGSDQPEPVLIEGLESWQTATFDAAGRLYLGAGPDLWGGVLVPTEHEKAADFAWQIRAFRIAALGTPMAGEGANAGQIIHSIGAGGGRLFIAMRSEKGSSLLRVTAPLPMRKDGSLDRLLDLKERWVFQQKVTASSEWIGAPGFLPNLPTVAVGADGRRVVYRTAATGVRRWWLVEKSGKPRMISEESD